MNNKLSRIFFAGCLLAGLSAGLTACNKGAASKLKVGLILLHSPDSSTYDKNFEEAFRAAEKKLGFKAVVKAGVPEGDECQTTAEALADQGCDIVFADSFGHEDYMIAAAKSHPNTMFCHATGVKAAATNLDNYVNAFASIYEGRYLAGVTAGLKLKELYGENITDAQAKVGYVGAFPYAEVKSGYTSWFLGVRSVITNATMEVTFTNSWYDENAEKSAAEKLIARGATLISQHADSYGAPNACEQARIPNVSYNGSTLEQCPNTFLVSSRINWQPYYEHVIDCRLKGKAVEKDYAGGFDTGSVELTAFSKNCAAGTEEYVNGIKEKLNKGELHVFDITKFTVGGETPSNENCAPSKQYTFDYPEGTQFIKDGYYHESEYRSAPSFDVDIDGIKNIDLK